MFTPFKVRGIGAFKHKFSEFAVLFLFFPGRNNVGDLVYALFQCPIHLIGGFCANLLISINIMFSETLVIKLEKKSTLIDFCGVIFNVNAK